MKKRILIMHPEGNISNNPNLSGIVEILCENDYEVDICASKRKYYQQAPCNGARLILRNRVIERIKTELVNTIVNPIVLRNILFLSNRTIKNYDFIIGVDRQGIIETGIVAEKLGMPHALISYEIVFESETSLQFKMSERIACRNIKFAVCQDRLRAEKLSVENDIPFHKIIQIPVAGRAAKKGRKTTYLHEKLKIPFNKKIALYAGSLAEWAMIDELLESIIFWPDQWVLVLHQRYGVFNNYHARIRRYIDSGRIYISDEPIPEHRDIHKLFHAADLGVAFYKPTYKGITEGKNLEYIGLSSGKISTYLQHGLPILTNEIGEMSDLIRKHGVGFVVNDFSTLPDILNNFTGTDAYRERCYAFFEQELGLEKMAPPLINNINEVLKSHDINDIR